MQELSYQIDKIGCEPGPWIRPLLTKEKFSDSMYHPRKLGSGGGLFLYPSNDGFFIEETKTMTQNLFAENMLCFPEINIAVCAEQNLSAEVMKTAQIINLNEVYDKEMQKDVKAFADYQSKVITEMEEKTVSTLFDALKIHDDLEKLYIDAIDKKWLNNKYFEIRNKI